MLRILIIVMTSLCLLLLFCTLICGMWIGANGTDAAGAGFHMTIGIASAVSGMVVCVLALVSSRRLKKLTA